MIGGLSMTEVIIILGLALLLLGPDQLPQMAKSIGKGLREIRKATDDLKGQFEQEMVNLDEAPKRMIAPVPSPPLDPAAAAAAAAASAAAAADPAAARANARTAASLPPAPAAPAAPPAPADPAEARATARRAAADAAKLKLVPPAGTVPREDV